MVTDTASPAVVVVGAYNHGVTMRVPAIPVPGETVTGDSYAEGPGGKGSNQAVAAARLGAAVSFVGRVGDDRFGEQARALWDREGVTAFVETVDKPTGVGFVIVDETGENAITVAPGANDTLDGAAVRATADTVAAADVALVQLEIGDEPVATTVDLAAANSTETVLNPAPARTLPSAVLDRVDVLTPNRTEARALAGLAPDADVADETVAASLLDRGPDAVVLTQGAAGALVHTPSQTTTVPGPSVKVVDTTGAGDAFNAGFAVARAEGTTLADAARFGTVVGSLTCTGSEVIPALPDRATVEAHTVE
ncbi:MAG: sugar kinase, ribokinase family [halophilic archaeon J07HX5]|jgi:Sugar kinases, ribokinase family|nr:MAG: sugar kinase, ribokinase family [halophilic archaeon J07HX5]